MRHGHRILPHLHGTTVLSKTNLNKRLDEADNPKPWSKPINWVDEVSMRHNIDYGNSTRLEEKHEANREMLYNLSLIQNPTLR